MKSRSIFIISTGRTGTTYLEQCLSAHFDQVFQEPGLSHLIYMLSNLAATNAPVVAKPAGKWALSLYQRDMIKRCAGQPFSHYIEINPFLSNILPDVARLPETRPDVLMHMVREPYSWIKSMMQFGAYSWRKPLVKHLPYVYYRNSLIEKWSSLTFAQKLAHEWLFRNQRINEAKPNIHSHFTIRYEDAFQSGKFNHRALKPLFDVLDMDIRAVENETPVEVANASTQKVENWEITESEKAYICAVTHDLAKQFGYE